MAKYNNEQIRNKINELRDKIANIDKILYGKNESTSAYYLAEMRYKLCKELSKFRDELARRNKAAFAKRYANCRCGYSYV